LQFRGDTTISASQELGFMDPADVIPQTDDPFALFDAWFRAATAAEPLPEAMTLATVTPDGRPDARMVLLKGHGPAGFVFFTNTQSRKGLELGTHPVAALCLYWKSLSRQVRIEGPVQPVTVAEADAYFTSRPRESQIAAWASLQSETLPQRGVLVERYRTAENRYSGGPVPRPPHWSGYRLAPTAIEFWQDVPNRLHDRLLFERDGSAWRARRLYP
jgi:pyridoxamine 5'-phosphate oxidase